MIILRALIALTLVGASFGGAKAGECVTTNVNGVNKTECPSEGPKAPPSEMSRPRPSTAGLPSMPARQLNPPLKDFRGMQIIETQPQPLGAVLPRSPGPSFSEGPKRPLPNLSQSVGLPGSTLPAEIGGAVRAPCKTLVGVCTPLFTSVPAPGASCYCDIDGGGRYGGQVTYDPLASQQLR